MKRNIALILIILMWVGASNGTTRAQNQGTNEPLTLQGLNLLLRREVGRSMTEADLALRVERLGIAFDPTPEIISRLRANGAHPHLINTIKRVGDRFSATRALGNTVVTTEKKTDTFIEETRKTVIQYLDELPDFICQEVIERYYDLDGTGAWDRGDTLTYELTYNRKRESYKPVNTVGRPITKSLQQAGGAYSTGDFASGLASLFDPDTKTIFKPAGKERLGNRQTILYDFRVPQESSKLSVKAEGAPDIFAGYSGTIWIDAETKHVLRIEQSLDDLPKSFPVTNSESSVDYDRFARSLLLPTGAQNSTSAIKSFSSSIVNSRPTSNSEMIHHLLPNPHLRRIKNTIHGQRNLPLSGHPRGIFDLLRD
jgi:hypothetical protein